MWDRKADLHCGLGWKDFVDIHSITDRSDPVVNNVKEDSTMSGWTGEHSLQCLESPSSEEEAVYTAYGYGRENNEDAIEEAIIVADPKKPQERKVGINVKHMEYLNNDFDTEEGWDDAMTRI